MSSYLGPLSALSASVTWAFASTRYAAMARSQGALRVGLVRATVASCLWWTALLVEQGPRALSVIDLRHAASLVGSIICSYALGDRLFFSAAARLGVPAALAIATIYPLWAALYGVALRGEPLGVGRAAGVSFCLLGVSAVLRLSRTPNAQAPTAKSAALVGTVLALLTSLFWAGNAVLLKIGTEGLSLPQANAVRFPVGMLLLLAQVRFFPDTAATEPRLAYPVLARRLTTALVFDAALGSLCFVYGIAHTDLALGATLTSLSPLVALPIAVALKTERVTPGKAAAVCLTLAGVLLLVTSA